jgi:sodium/hydrogen antiporter
MGARHTIVETLARLALGIGLVGVALRVPREYPRREWREIAVLIGFGMPLMWLSSTALVWVIAGLPFWVAALIGAMITPTDPIGASPVVTGELAERYLPGRVRHVISFESGANDGVSYLLVFLPLLLLTPPVLLALRPLLPNLHHWRDVLFVGWFGPIAIAALYYAALAESHWAEPVVWHVVTLIIVGSAVVHGATAAPGTRLYGLARARAQADPGPADPMP